MPAHSGVSAMAASFRHRPYLFITIGFCIAFILFYQSGVEGSGRRTPPPIPPQEEGSREQQPGTTPDGTWNYTRDANNLLLTSRQCDAAFPGLFEEVERPLALRRARHITLKEVDAIVPKNGYIRCLIYDQRLYIIATEGAIYSRGLATLHALHRALLTSPEPLPNIEFSFNVDDAVSSESQWAYARRPKDKDLWLMPDFGFWSWPETKLGSYSEIQMKASMVDATKGWKEKTNKLLWRGATMGLEIREKFLKATENKDWADVKQLDWHNKESMTNDLKSMDQHCEYKYLAHTEGNTYSGRLKYLQNCRSVVVAHKLEWIQHHHPLMKSSGSEQNYVEVDRDFGNLEEVMRGLQGDDKGSEQIADRMVKMFRERYLTPAAEACYWRRLIRGWAEVSFQPEFFKEEDGKKKWRGLPVESYLLERRLDWEPY